MAWPKEALETFPDDLLSIKLCNVLLFPLFSLLELLGLCGLRLGEAEELHDVRAIDLLEGEG